MSLHVGYELVMGGNKDKKRKNSSKGETPKSTRGTKEQKKAGNINTSSHHSLLVDNSQFENSQVENGSYLTLLNLDNGSTDQVFNGSYCQSDCSKVHNIMDNGNRYINTQQYMTSSNVGQCSPQGSTMNNITPVNMQHVYSPTPCVQNQSGKHVTNEELMLFMSAKFDEMNSRLSKLELVEKKVSEMDIKINKLWSDLDSRVAKSADKLNSLEESVDVHVFSLDETRNQVTKLQTENKELKESLSSIQAKQMMNNLIIGGIKECEHETNDQTVTKVKEYFKDDLKIPEDEAESIEIERAYRSGIRKGSKPKNIVVTFKDFKTKQFVKSFKVNVDSKATGLYMHDQYPSDVVAQRKRLIPIMKKARDDKKEAYIKYNKLIIDGKIYTDGKYGSVA